MKTRKQRKTERLYKKLTNLDHSPTLTVLDMEEVTNNLYYSALIVHFVVGNNPTYQGVPIKTSQIIEKGNIVVYDDVSHNWL